MDKAHHTQHMSFLGTIIQLRVDGKDYPIDIATPPTHVVGPPDPWESVADTRGRN